ncbi:nitroreductase [Litorisediminicola beolgyonensis]|uniref:Nitroreductase n=1 Tax=Litorisediminicola beolgyonensis TaxID=1173614 RepID=A0ABW3ZJ64_9RHOB
MSFDALMRSRWSCRAFRPDPVPRGVLDAILGTAQQTASWNNVQPWQVVLTSGAATERLREALCAAFDAGLEPDPHIPFPEAYEGVYRDRRRACGFQLYDAVGITRDDSAARSRQSRRNFELFDAPHALIVTTEAKLGTYGVLDCGAYVHNVMIAAAEHGVASIAQGALATVSPLLAEQFDLPEGRNVVCGVALGYADEDHPINRYRVPRAPVADAVRFVE